MTSTLDRPAARARPGQSATDPRIRARKVEVARAAGRRRLRAVLAVLAACALVLGVVVVLHSPLLAVRHVALVGAQETSLAQVEAVTGLGRRPPLIDVDTAVDAAALERLPWVARATVAKVWPSGVRITLTERHPVAEVAAGIGTFALVDATGRVLEDTSVRVRELALVARTPRLPPPGGDVAAAELPAIAVAGAVPVSLVSRVASVWVARGGDVDLRLTTGPTVVLGSASDLRAKMVSLATVLARVPLASVVTIDLRVPEDPVLTSR